MSSGRSAGGWRKSSRSGAQSNCVEACLDGVVVRVRNSNDPHPGGPVLGVPVKEWLMLLDRVCAGDLSLGLLMRPVHVAGLAVSYDGVGVVLERTKASSTVRFTPGEWQAFLDGASCDGEFTLEWLLEDPAPA